MDLAPPASGAAVRPRHQRGTPLGRFEALAGAKSDANAAGFAPGFKDLDAVLPGWMDRLCLRLLNPSNRRYAHGRPPCVGYRPCVVNRPVHRPALALSRILYETSSREAAGLSVRWTLDSCRRFPDASVRPPAGYGRTNRSVSRLFTGKGAKRRRVRRRFFSAPFPDSSAAVH